jgi:hypothetical protein
MMAGDLLRFATVLAPKTAKNALESMTSFMDKIPKGIAGGNMYNAITGYVAGPLQGAESLIGGRLAGLVTTFADGIAQEKTSTFYKLLQEKTGFNPTQVKSYYDNLVGPAKNNFKIKKGVPVSDLNDANAFIDNAKNMFLGGAIGQLFSDDHKAFTLRELSVDAIGGNFLKSQLVNSTISRLAIGGLSSSIPGVDIITGAALGTKGLGGSGTSFALQKYGIND